MKSERVRPKCTSDTLLTATALRRLVFQLLFEDYNERLALQVTGTASSVRRAGHKDSSTYEICITNLGGRCRLVEMTSVMS